MELVLFAINAGMPMADNAFLINLRPGIDVTPVLPDRVTSVVHVTCLSTTKRDLGDLKIHRHFKGRRVAGKGMYYRQVNAYVLLLLDDFRKEVLH